MEKLEWGSEPKLRFSSQEEFYRTLGQITNDKAFAITYEANKRTGSYSDAYRLRILGDSRNVTEALISKRRTGNRINCNEFVEHCINAYSFTQSGNVIMRNFQDVLQCVPDKYKQNFMQGYSEVYQIKGKRVFYYTEEIDVSNAVIEEKPLPKGKGRNVDVTKKRQGKRDYIKAAIDNIEIGEAGERLVYEHEKKKLNNALAAGEISDMKDKLEWVSRADDSKGYDIRSFNVDKQEEMFIEVKTTVSSPNTPFYISENEMKASADLGDKYYIYRLYGMKRANPDSVDYYVLNGDISQNESVIIEKGSSIVRLVQGFCQDNDESDECIQVSPASK